MRSVLLASAALVAAPAATPLPSNQPAAEAAGKARKGLITADKPNAAQRVIPGLF